MKRFLITFVLLFSFFSVDVFAAENNPNDNVFLPGEGLYYRDDRFDNPYYPKGFVVKGTDESITKTISLTGVVTPSSTNVTQSGSGSSMNGSSRAIYTVTIPKVGLQAAMKDAFGDDYANLQNLTTTLIKGNLKFYPSQYSYVRTTGNYGDGRFDLYGIVNMTSYSFSGYQALEDYVCTTGTVTADIETYQPYASYVMVTNSFQLLFDVTWHKSSPDQVIYLSDNQALNALVESFKSSSTGDTMADLEQKQLDQDKQFHDEEVDKAESGVSDQSEVIGQLQGLGGEDGPWKILWYPITFTKRVIGVFTGAEAQYISEAGVTGFVYDEDSGYILPTYDLMVLAGESPPEAPGGAVLTWPAFTLNLGSMGSFKLWDSYDFDLTTIKDQFPLAFNVLYIADSVVLLYAFVGFLRSKYEEVFG